jgi:large subunit ribosomal protein L29
MTPKEIRDLSAAEITTKIREIRESLLQARMRKMTGQVEKTHELRALRKDVARLETILRQKNKPAPVAA